MKWMRSPIFWVPIALILLSLVSYVSQAHVWREKVADGEGIAWAKDVDTESSKPALVYFTASWCGPCQSMSRQAWPDKEIVELVGQFQPVKVDIDEQPLVARYYNIESVPTIVVLEEGVVTARTSGYSGVLNLEDFLRQNLPSATDETEAKRGEQ